MKKPLRKRIADAIKILKGEPLPIDLAPMPKIREERCEVRTISARCEYRPLYFHPNTPREGLRRELETELAYEIGKALLREGVIQFREDDYEPALHAMVRVVMPPKGE